MLCALVLCGYAFSLGTRLIVLMVLAETFASVFAALVLVVGHINSGLLATDDPGVSWTENLMLTTASFSTESRVARWLTGGMSHHLAHHLRPVAVRSELPMLHRTVVQETSVRTGLAVVEFDSFTAAVVGHWRRMRELGRDGLADLQPSEVARAAHVVG
jgi:linoleoyl-CoA desaturase